ncbi:MAG TPA: N-formylglutamate amidohydrolase [Flavobacteriales bacterium]|nr:N-formylglutamate amidohydrolase [Flavobacteriales bacterium]
MEDTVLQEELLLLTDWHTDHLYVTAIAVVAPFSRIFCDAELFTDDALEVMAARGMGVLYTHTDAGTPMRQVDAALRERILRTWYAPHHARLRTAVEQQLNTQGTALVVDCHSYPDAPLLRDLDRTPGRPAFSIGTDPVHTPPELIAAAVAYFAAQGHPLAIDRPYRGTLVPTPWYGTDARVRSIMLEVNRALYLQPGNDQRSAGYARTRALVQGFLEVLRGFL